MCCKPRKLRRETGDSLLVMFPLALVARYFASLLSAVSLLLGAAESVRSAQLDTLNLSYSALVPSGAPFWIAQDLKLFEREGLKTQLLYINAAPRVMAAILAGEVQISLSGVSPLVLTYAQGSDPVAIAGGG